MTLLVNSRDLVLKALDSSRSSFQSSILAMYNSRIGGIIKDHSLMSISIDDHMVHRGHSVFDTLLVTEGLAYNLKRHLHRIESSALQAKIEMPLPIDSISKILLDLAASTGQKELSIRYWISAGPGNMAIWPVSGQSSFYAIAYATNMKEKFKSVREYTVSIPLKPAFLAVMKSTNYLLNALCAMESKAKGGQYGVQTDEEGFITEGSVNNICFILPDKVLVTPPFDNILHGTTVDRVLHYAQELVQTGDISRIEQRKIHKDEAKTCIEMFLTSGDTVSPVLEWDDVTIGNGSVGKISQFFIEKIKEDHKNPEICVPIDYSIYSDTQ